MIKVQLNAKALEYLFASMDEETKIEIQNSIVQEFTRKYLKDIANTEIVNTAKHEIQKYVKTNVYKDKTWRKIELDKKVIDEIRKNVENELRDVVSTQVTDVLNSESTKEYINELITRLVKYDLHDKVVKIMHETLDSYKVTDVKIKYNDK